MAIVGSSTAAAISRMRTIFFETLHLSKGTPLMKCKHSHPKYNPTVLNMPFKKIYRNQPAVFWISRITHGSHNFRDCSKLARLCQRRNGYRSPQLLLLADYSRENGSLRRNIR